MWKIARRVLYKSGKNARGVKRVKDVPQQTVANVVTVLTNRSLVVKVNENSAAYKGDGRG